MNQENARNGNEAADRETPGCDCGAMMAKMMKGFGRGCPPGAKVAGETAAAEMPSCFRMFSGRMTFAWVLGAMGWFVLVGGMLLLVVRAVVTVPHVAWTIPAVGFAAILFAWVLGRIRRPRTEDEDVSD